MTRQRLALYYYQLASVYDEAARKAIRLGLAFDNGYPTKAARQKLLNEQRRAEKLADLVRKACLDIADVPEPPPSQPVRRKPGRAAA